MVWMACSADAPVMDFGHAGAGGLVADGRGKVDFVAGRADAGSDHNHQVSGLCSSERAEVVDPVGDDPELRSHFPGMKQGAGATIARHHPDRGAVRHVDPERDATRRGEQSVDSGEGRWIYGRVLHDGDNRPVHLFRGNEGICATRLVTQEAFVMRG